MEEQWKDVVGLENYFTVSNYGNVFSKRTCKILAQNTTKLGYKTIATKIGGRNGHGICLKVHRLVAEAFLLPPAEYQVEWANKSWSGIVLVRHLDGNPSNNRIDNLAWGTIKENYNDYRNSEKYKNRHANLRSEDNGCAKLTYEIAEHIRGIFVLGHRTFGASALGRLYGVSRNQIMNIINNLTYTK